MIQIVTDSTSITPAQAAQREACGSCPRKTLFGQRSTWTASS